MLATMTVRLPCLVAACAALAWAQPSPQDTEALIEKIKATVLENLRRLPNYTCTETIHRSERPKNIVKPTLNETIHLEVAYVEGKEFFGWPGAAKIDQPEIGKMVDGSMGNGYFGLFQSAIFSTRSAIFQYAGEAPLHGKEALRFGYLVPKIAATYRLTTELGEAVVGFHGSFWVDRKTLELMRITVEADDPPVVLGLAATSSVLDFSPQTFGASTFVLPRGAELQVVDTDGNEGQARLSFAACHQFVGESVIKFEEPETQPAAPVAEPVKAAVALPDDFFVDFVLETPIEWESSATGDPVRGTLRDSVQDQGRAIVPKGAKLVARIAHLAQRGDLYYVEITFASLDFPGGHADLSGRRNGVSVNNVPLVYPTTRFKLTRGARLTLHSRLLKSEKHDSIRP